MQPPDVPRQGYLVKTLGATKMFLAGTCAGIAEALATTPIETVKVRMQNAAQVQPGVRLAFLEIFRNIARTEGLAALYRGAGPRVVNGAVAASVLFGVNSELRKAFGANGSQPLAPVFLLAACFTGVSEALIYCPIELVRTRLQATVGPASQGGALELAAAIWKAEGLLGLYRGFPAMLPKESAGNVAYFTTYEGMRTLLGRGARGKSKARDRAEIVVAGACAGGAYGFIIHPVDTVKTVLQSEVGPSRFKGAVDCAQLLYRRGGLSALYAGLYPSMVRSMVANGITFLTLEYTVERIEEAMAASASQQGQKDR